jgi:hypothetical protein
MKHLMKLLSIVKLLLLIILAFLVLSLSLAEVSLFPTNIGGTRSHVLINDTFALSPNETYKQGIGSFQGGENISFLIQSPTVFQKNFSINYPNSTYMLLSSGSSFSISTKSNITYSFIADDNYFEAVFTDSSKISGVIHFQVTVREPATVFAYSWLTPISKTMFITSLSLIILLTLKITLSASSNAKLSKLGSQTLSKKNRYRLIALLSLSVIVWFGVLAVNTNPLATFQNWYTDNGRHTYVSSLFLKDGFSVFNQPLNKLASLDTAPYKFVTWPEMPHLYPLGSILLFLPFGILLQSGFDSALLYKVEIAIFLFFATLCVYFFLKDLFRKDMALILKLIGVYIIYVALMVYAADGMFDSVAFIFSLFAISMLMVERYDYFFLLVMVSTFFKYQAGIFLFPLIIVGLIKIFQTKNQFVLLRNKAVIVGFIFGFVSIFTAFLSAPFFMATGSQFITNGINAFSSNIHISWLTQSISVFLTLAITISYSIYMLNKNSLLSLSSIFLLLPSFLLPYFQIWYVPFVFIYALIPQGKKELEVTMMWLLFMIFMLSFAGANYFPFVGYLPPRLPNPLQIS